MAIDYSKWSDDDIVAASENRFQDLSDSALIEYSSSKEPIKLKSKTTWAEDWESAGKGVGNVLESGRDAVNILAAKARESFGMQPDSELGAGEDIAANMQAREARMQDPSYNPVVGKEQGAGVLANVLPNAAAMMTPGVNLAYLLGTGMSRGQRSIEQGASPTRAALEGVGSVGLTGAMMAIPPAFGGLTRGQSNAAGAAVGAATTPLEAVGINVGRAGTELPSEEVPSNPWDYVAGAATGGLMSQVAHKGSTVPKTPDAGISQPLPQAEATNIALVNLQDSVAKGEKQVVQLKTRIANSDNLVASATHMGDREAAAKGAQQKLRAEQQLQELNVELLQKYNQISKYKQELPVEENLQKPQEDATLPVEDPLPPAEDIELVRARMEEDAAARAEQAIEPEVIARDDQGYVQGLQDNIANLERFLATKQGNKETRAKIAEELVQTKAELDTFNQENPSARKSMGNDNTGIVTKKLSEDKQTVVPKSPEELLGEAKTRTKDPVLSKLVDSLLESFGSKVDDIKLSVDPAYLRAKGASAAFLTSARRVVFDNFTSPVEIVHEFMHAATNDVMMRVATGNLTGLLPVQIRAADRIVGIFNAIKKDKRFDAYQEGLDSPAEVMAYFSDANFRMKLEGLLTPAKWKATVNDIATALARSIGLYKDKDIQVFKDNYKQFLKDTETLVFENINAPTPRAIVDSFDKMYNRVKNSPSPIKAELDKTADLGDVDKVLPAEDVLKSILTSDSEVSAFGRRAAFLQGAGEATLFNVDSLPVRNTYAAIKQADGTYEYAKRLFLDGVTAASNKIGPFMKLTNLQDYNSFSNLFKRTHEKTMLEVAPLIIEANATGMYITNHPKFKQLSKEAQELARGAVDVLERIFRYKAEQANKFGAKKDPYKVGYWPHMRGNGDYGVQVYYKNGLPAEFRRFRTEAERDLYRETYLKHDPSVKVETLSVEEVREADRKSRTEEQLKLQGKLELLAEQHGVDTPEYRAAKESAEKTAYMFGGHHLEQGYQAGFKGNHSFIGAEKNARDLFEAIFDYADETARMARNAELLHLTDGYLSDEVIKDHKIGERPDVQLSRDIRNRTIESGFNDYKIFDQILDNTFGAIVAMGKRKLGYQDVSKGMPEGSVWKRAHGAATTVVSVAIMTSKLAFHVAQAISWIPQTMQYLSLKHNANMFDVSGSVVQGMYHMMHDGTGSEFHKILAQASTEHPTFHPTTMNDITRIQVMLKEAKQLERAANAIGSWLSGIKIGEMAETFSRYMASAVNYAHGKKLGYKGDALYKYVVNGTDGAMGLFQQDKKAPLITQTGPIGDLMSPVSTYAIMLNNWTATSFKRAFTKGEFQPLMTLMLTSMMAGGLVAAPVLAEYEFLRTVYNSFLNDEEDKLPSLERVMLNSMGTGSNVGDVALEMGLPAAATTAAAQSMGYDRGIDMPGLRYQAAVQPSKESASLLDRFTTASVIAKDMALVHEIWKTGGTDSDWKKLLTQLRSTWVQQFVVDQFLFPPLKDSSGKETVSIGKGSEMLHTRTPVDTVAIALGTKSTATVRESKAYVNRKDDDRTKNNEINKALQIFFDAKIRQKDKNEGKGLPDREGMAIKRLQSLGKKYPDEANYLEKIASGWQNAVDKQKRASIIRDLEKAKPHALSKMAKEWANTTNNEVSYK
jgi:hypothetical protein